MLYTSLGTYINSFFNFNLNTNLPITTNLLKSPSPLLSVFIHEYLHYLQDISTVYGLINMDMTFVRIGHFYHITDRDIILPYTNFKTKDKIFEDNVTLFEVYENPADYFDLPNNQKDGNEIKIKIREETLSKLYFETGEYDVVRAHYVIYKKGKNYRKEIPFGAQAIQECMARILENKIFNVQNDGKLHIPYDLPTVIIKSKYPRLAACDEYIFALCDASLMYYNPGDCFIHILNVMKARRFRPISVKSIYDFIFQNVSFKEGTLFELYDKAIEKSKESLGKIVMPGFEDARDWFNRSIDYFCNKRRTNITFLTDIIDSDPKKTMNNFYGLVLNNTSPLFYNNQYDFQILTNLFIPSTGHDSLMYWYFLERMYNFVFIEKNNRCCPYKNFCNYHNSYVCNDDRHPLLKAETGCLFDQYMKIFNLHNRNVLNK